MKISKETIDVLVNFSRIYEAIVLRPGNIIRTATPSVDIFAMAVVQESFPAKVTISDLNKFISALMLFKGEDPEVDFTETHATITSGKKKISYTLGELTKLQSVKAAPETDPKVPPAVTKVSVSQDVLSGVEKALGVLGLAQLTFKSGKDGVFLSCGNPNNSAADAYSIKLSDDDSPEVSISIPKTALKMIPQDYVVHLDSSYVKFEGPKVSYWIPALAE